MSGYGSDIRGCQKIAEAASLSVYRPRLLTQLPRWARRNQILKGVSFWRDP